MKLPANGSASLPKFSKSREESSCIGSREGEDAGDESINKPGDDGGDDNVEAEAEQCNTCMKGKRKKGYDSHSFVFIVLIGLGCIHGHVYRVNDAPA